jgi:hypothetical protein
LLRGFFKKVDDQGANAPRVDWVVHTARLGHGKLFSNRLVRK